MCGLAAHPRCVRNTNGPTTNALSRTVVDTAGTPVAGAFVKIYHTNDKTSLTALTDATGRYAPLT